MRLLKYRSKDDLELVAFPTGDPPPYAILSHRWIDGEEVTYDELVAFPRKEIKHKAGYAKIRFCGERAARDGLQYFWVDTCCIDKSNRAELQTAVSSMFYWYRRATKCYVYLSDVSLKKRKRGDKDAQDSWQQAFRESEWFKRGWTLQELLAPASVEFFSVENDRLGDRKSLEQQIYEITAIPKPALRGEHLTQFNVNERLSWTETRETTLEEDLAYSLLGIFGISIPLRYGEGRVKAFERLQHEIDKLEKCIQELRHTDPRDDKKRIEETKGGLLEGSYHWVLDNPDFLQWRNDQQSRVLWIKGDPGKGKTMLVCGIIDELKNSIAKTDLLLYFFCQATDSRINSATAVIRGLLYMLVDQQPCLVSHVRRKYDQAGKKLFEDANAWIALSAILTNILQDPSLGKVYIIVDALDECSTDLPKLLDFIAQHSLLSSPAKWLVSGRNWPSIKRQLDTAAHKANLSLELNEKYVADAIASYIQIKVDDLASYNKYTSDTRSFVHKYLIQNAHGTFLWVALVCQEIKYISGWKVRKKLTAFPPGLQGLYGRMMEDITNSEDAELCKRILAVISTVYRPITLSELVSLVDMPEDISGEHEALLEIIGLCGSFLTTRRDTITFVHQSAKDYLVNNAYDEIFPVGIQETHYEISSKSLGVISRTLHRDMYELGALGYPIEQVRQPDPDPLAALYYSCVYWIDHLRCCVIDSSANYGDNLKDGGAVMDFLGKKFLYWLEALSLDRNLSEGVVAMGKLEALVQVSTPASCMIVLTP
jgi:hypothetical protein